MTNLGLTGTFKPEVKRKTNLLDGMSSAERKEYPVATGFLNYFRDAIYRAAKVSYDGNRKHNPGQPTHWARGKSDDHEDCLARHMMVNEEEELANAFWRAGARLQLFLEAKYNIEPPSGCVLPEPPEPIRPGAPYKI